MLLASTQATTQKNEKFFSALKEGDISQFKLISQSKITRSDNIIVVDTITDSDGNSPLHVASFVFNSIATNLLLKAGADIELKNNANETAYRCYTNDTFHNRDKKSVLPLLLQLPPSSYSSSECSTWSFYTKYIRTP